MILLHLTEYAKSKSKVINSFENKEDILREHLIKIFFWKNSDCLYHWEGEIFANIPTSIKLKGSNKYLSKKAILASIYSYHDIIDSSLQQWVSQICVQETDLPEYNVSSYDKANFKKFCNEFFDHIATELSTIGAVDKKTIYDLLDRLLSKYSYTR